jgi:hypothetical protein
MKLFFLFFFLMSSVAMAQNYNRVFNGNGGQVWIEKNNLKFNDSKHYKYTYSSEDKNRFNGRIVRVTAGVGSHIQNAARFEIQTDQSGKIRVIKDVSYYESDRIFNGQDGKPFKLWSAVNQYSEYNADGSLSAFSQSGWNVDSKSKIKNTGVLTVTPELCTELLHPQSITQKDIKQCENVLQKVAGLVNNEEYRKLSKSHFNALGEKNDLRFISGKEKTDRGIFYDTQSFEPVKIDFDDLNGSIKTYSDLISLCEETKDLMGLKFDEPSKSKSGSGSKQ